MKTIYILVTTDAYDHFNRAAYIAAPYDAKDAIKELPRRRWNPSRKRWVIPATDVKLAAQHLRGYGWQVQIGDDAPAPRSAATWADALYDQLPAELHAAVYAALAKILHPDIGGDLDAMQQLNVARDRHMGAA